MEGRRICKCILCKRGNPLANWTHSLRARMVEQLEELLLNLCGAEADAVLLAVEVGAVVGLQFTVGQLLQGEQDL